MTAAGNALPATPSGPVVSVRQSGQFVRYVLREQAEQFAAELEHQGALDVHSYPLSLREIFLEVVRKEEAVTSGSVGNEPQPAMS